MTVRVARRLSAGKCVIIKASTAPMKVHMRRRLQYIPYFNLLRSGLIDYDSFERFMLQADGQFAI